MNNELVGLQNDLSVLHAKFVRLREEHKSDWDLQHMYGSCAAHTWASISALKEHAAKQTALSL